MKTSSRYRLSPGRGEGPDLGHAALDALILRPGFDRVALAVARGAVEQYRQSWALNRILSDRGRAVAAFMALDLHFAEPGGAGFTLAQLRKEAARHGFASAGRVTAWAATLRLLGFFAAGAPGRPQRLVPTKSFFAMLRTRMQFIWQALGTIHPPALLAIELLQEDAFLGHLAAGFMDPYRSGQRVFDGIPELARVAEREAGICVLLSVMLADAAGKRVSIASLAREFAVSRAHIRAILQEAERMGLVARTQLNGEYQVEPNLMTWMRRFFAALFQAHIFAIDRALARHSVEAALSQ